MKFDHLEKILVGTAFFVFLFSYVFRAFYRPMTAAESMAALCIGAAPILALMFRRALRNRRNATTSVFYMKMALLMFLAAWLLFATVRSFWA